MRRNDRIGSARFGRLRMKKISLLLALSVASGCAQPEPTTYQVFGIGKFRQIRSDPKRHAGKLYAFAGRVINAEQTREKVSFQMLVQDRIAGLGERLANDGPLVVVYPAPDTTVADDHQVKVLGYIRQPDVGENVFGTTVSSFKLDAIALYDTFTMYPFWLPGYEELFDKWKTGDPLPEVRAQ